MESKINDKIMQMCPSFDNCNSPICSLDRYNKRRTRLPNEPKCVATKRTRLGIGIKFNLKNFGLTAKEVSSINKFYPNLESYIRAKFSDLAIGLSNNTQKEAYMPNWLKGQENKEETQTNNNN